MPKLVSHPLVWLAAIALGAALAFVLADPRVGAHARTRVAAEDEYLQGKLLVATPQMSDPRFVETVIYMVRHNAEGAMGLVVNRVLGAGPIAKVMEEFGVEGAADADSIRIHYGGPVQLEVVSVLHSNDYVNEGSLLVGDSVAFTTNVEILQAIADGNGPRRRLFVLGYSGWGPGQLEAEIGADAWFSIPAEDSLIFGEDVDSVWERAMARRGIDL